MKTIIVTDDAQFASQISESLKSVGAAGALSAYVTDLTGLDEVIPTPASGVLLLLDARRANADVCLAVERLARTTEAFVVVAGRAERPSDVLDFIRAGAHDYIDARANLQDELKSMLQRKDARRGSTTARGRLITVTSCGGGSGASTIATNLAAVLAGQTGNCGLVDLHPCGGDLATILQLEPDFTLHDLAKKGEALDAMLLQKSMVRHRSGINLLASPPPYREDRYVSTKVIQRILSLAMNEFSYVVVDGEDAFHHEQLTTIRESDQIVLVFRLDFASLARAKHSLDHLVSVEKVPLERILLVAGRAGQPKELPMSSAERVLGHTIAQCVPCDPASALAAINIGAPVVTEAPASAIAKAIQSLASRISGGRSDKVDLKENLSKKMLSGAASLLRIASF